MAVEVRIPNGPLYIDMDGFRLGRGFELETFRSSLTYRPQDDDKFVVTFPKCGTTWVQHIVYLLYHEGVPPPDGLDFLMASPFLEMYGAETVARTRRPALIKSHLPHGLMPKSPHAKYIYVCRNPKDTCVSFFHHTRGFSGYDFAEGTLDVFFEVFMNGQNDHEDYFDHVLSWYEHRSDPNVLFLHYEDIKTDPGFYIKKIAEFLDDNLKKKLDEDKTFLERVVANSDINQMKHYAEKNFKEFFTKPVDDEAPFGVKLLHNAASRFPGAVTFTRKGIVGDWKTHLTAEMNARLEEKIMKKLGHTDIVDVWKKYGIL